MTTMMAKSNGQKINNRFKLAKQQLCMCISFVYFFAVVAQLGRKLPSFTFFGGHKRKTTIFFFFFLT